MARSRPDMAAWWRVTAETVSATSDKTRPSWRDVPQTERDLSGISPAEFREARIPAPWREYREEIPVARWTGYSNPPKRYSPSHTVGSWEYMNMSGVAKKMWQLRSLNIPRETVEVRNNLISNLERDFGQAGESEKAA